MQLSNQQILELQAALRRLDGERGKSYKFGAKMRLQLAQRIRRLTELTEDIQKTQQKLAAQYQVTGGAKVVDGQSYPVDDPARTRAYSLEWTAFLRNPEEVQVGRFLLADLDLQTNSVSVQVLAHLIPVVSDLPKATVAKFKLTLNEVFAATKAFGRLETETREFKAGYLVKLNLAEIWRQLSIIAEQAEVKRQSMISERKLANYKVNAAGLWETADEPAQLKALDAAWAAERALPTEFELPVVKYTELDLDTNDVPGSVLGDLLAVLVEDEPAAEAKAD